MISFVWNFDLISEPSGPPQNVQAWTLSSTSIQVTWGPPLLEEQNGVILRYDVDYKTQSGQPNKLATADNQTTIQVKNLTSFTRYWFAVRAVNVIGVGPESEEVSNTTSEDSKLKKPILYVSLWDSVFQSSFCSKTKGVSRTITNQCYVYLRKLTYELIKEQGKKWKTWASDWSEQSSALRPYWV